MKRVAVVLLLAAACTTPDYRFEAPDAGGPSIQGRDSGAGDDDDASDAGADAIDAVDAAPLPKTEMPSTESFDDDCTNWVKDAALAGTGAALLEDSDGLRHCVIFFHNDPWRRPWLEARVTCETITRGASRGHLAVFPNAEKATNLVTAKGTFPTNLAASIGLRRTGVDPADKASWTWVTGASVGFDGWAPGRPAAGGGDCAGWAGNGTMTPLWTDVDCANPKGFLCEVDGP